MKYTLSLFILLLDLVKTIDNSQDKNQFKDSLNTYEKMNYFETIDQNQSFIINTTVKSIAYFDSFDSNSIIYISKKYEDFISENDEKITGKFYPIEPNTKYYIRNYLYSSPSVFKKYLYPLDLNQSEIAINSNKEISFLYLEQNKLYTLNFKDNKISKMIRLSDKTLNSKIKIIKNGEEETEVNQTTPYYKLEENFQGKLILKVEESNAFIELLSKYEDEEVDIVTDVSKDFIEFKKNILVINILKTQKNFNLKLNSEKNFSFSLSYGLSNMEKYFYYSASNTKIKYTNKYSSSYVASVTLKTPFKNTNLLKNEFLSLSIFLDKASSTFTKLEYSQSSLMDKIYDEEISAENCNKIIENIKNILELYVYLDIAKNPPEIPGFPNYHHKRIDLKKELSNVSIANRKFYEFYQEIQKILATTRDLHFKIYSHETPKGIKFGQYYAALPFNFEIRKYNGKYRIFIIKNYYFYDYSEKQKNFINSHLKIPLKKINDIDPFEYIQNWSKYAQTKNPHAQFTNIINQISGFYLYKYPIDCSDLYNEYEFEDNKLIRIEYYTNFKNVRENDVEFNNYFLNAFKSQNVSIHMPPFHIIEDNFLISKGLKAEKKI